MEDRNTGGNRSPWPGVRPQPRNAEVPTPTNQPGPYETSYEITHGYPGERPIVRP